MKYICLVYAEPGALSGLSAAERTALDRDSLAYDRDLMARGQLLADSGPQPVSTASTIRVRGGGVLISDGPFAETKEVLSGFIFIEAADIEEAKRIAAGIPMA